MPLKAGEAVKFASNVNFASPNSTHIYVCVCTRSCHSRLTVIYPLIEGCYDVAFITALSMIVLHHY